MVVTRTFDAPVERVWRAWSDPDDVMAWWGPTVFTSPSARLDVRQGGTSLVCMRAPADLGGREMYNTGTDLFRVGMEQCLDKMAALVAPASR